MEALDELSSLSKIAGEEEILGRVIRDTHRPDQNQPGCTTETLCLAEILESRVEK